MNAVLTSVDDPDTHFTAIERWLRRQLVSRLAGFKYGYLCLSDALGQVELGSIDAPTALHVTIRIHDPRFYRMLAANGSVGAGEAWMDGYWLCDNLVGLIRLLVGNRSVLDGMETGLARLGGLAMRAWHAWQRNTRAGARRNIAAHYDLGNAFFRLFLSSDLMYSSALWQGQDDTLEAASTRKLERICAQLELKPDDHVIEIGTGWGGFAVYAARHYGCHVTTTTISREQYDLASTRVAEAGLQERVTLLLDDYRDLSGQFDKLVSIEMVEAIGAAQLDTYFGKIGQLLKPDGVALIQAITIEDHRYAQALKSVDFIKRHVFPGCFIPSIHAMLAAKTQSSDLALVDMHDFGESYARTLAAWHTRFVAQLDEVRKQGFDERFIRLWQFYLAYCEGGFRERSIGVAHFKLARPAWRPMTIQSEA
ncbi:MAG: cyclopropane-fatty-acyl-phospholipid synthase family protein [Xanthomonadales bacterium]|nr:cyclopropane-fatty-acyl-phospholipid synthase family protein [Xanthomonadales bacterium]